MQRAMVIVGGLMIGWLGSAPAEEPPRAEDLFRSDDASVEAEADDALLALQTPAAATRQVQALPDRLSPAQLAAVRELDRRWGAASPALSRELTGRLARSGEPRSLEYLHEVFETAPERREDIVRAIADYAAQRQRRPQDWYLLVRSLPMLEGDLAAQALAALGRFPQRSTKADVQRQAILAGLRGPDAAAAEAVRLLRHWTGESFDSLLQWQAWFQQAHPDLPPAELPQDRPGAKYTYRQLREFLQSPQAAEGDPRLGAVVFEKASCIRCHRLAGRGEALGPDLTTVRRKLQDKEILQSLLFPSAVISDDYAAQTVVDQRNLRHTGVITAAGGTIMVLKTDGEKISLPRTEIRQIVPSHPSAMPEGLLDALTLREIADLFAYLKRS